ncbi:MAG: hypothetical protein ACRDD6_13625 [Tannerellaceae bacterium]
MTKHSAAPFIIRQSHRKVSDIGGFTVAFDYQLMLQFILQNRAIGRLAGSWAIADQ